MIETCKRYIHEFHMIEAGDLVIAGVSGGADSLCLFHILNNLKGVINYTLKVVHVEHGIRGDESKEDAAFVEELCRKYGVFCRVYPVDVPSYSAKQHMGTEEAARILRYDALTREVGLAVEEGYRLERIKVALAHHGDDNAETMLFQLARGSGIVGLCGMKAIRQAQGGFFYIRPLLWATRSRIEAYLQSIGQNFCIDSTNSELDYSRNRLRKNVLPELEQINSEAIRHMNQTAKRLERIEDYLNSQAKMVYKDCVTQKERAYEIDVSALKQLHPALGEEIVKMAIYEAAGQKKDISAVHVESVLALCGLQSGKQVSLPYGMIARREFGKILITKNSTSIESAGDGAQATGYGVADRKYVVTSQFLEELKKTGKEAKISVDGGEFTLKIMKFLGNLEKIPKKRYTKFLDYDMIKIGFTIRTRCPQDHICIDQAGHHKKLKDYFVQEKVPKDQRERLWLMAQDSRILWVTGMRIAEDCKITENTEYGLLIQYSGGTEDGLQQTT